MNRFGYPMQLLPYQDWLARLSVDAEAPHHALHRLRSFFFAARPRVPRFLSSTSRARAAP